jgi:hypothetical protein
MTIPPSQDHSLGFLPGDHVRACYRGTIMHVLKTHPRVYVNGILIGNPHCQADQLPG